MVVVYSRADKIFRRIVTAGALTSLMLLGLIAAFLIFRSWDTFSQFGLKFITGSEWFSAGEDPLGGATTALAEADDASVFSIGPMIVGSLVGRSRNDRRHFGRPGRGLQGRKVTPL